MFHVNKNHNHKRQMFHVNKNHNHKKQMLHVNKQDRRNHGMATGLPPSAKRLPENISYKEIFSGGFFIPAGNEPSGHAGMAAWTFNLE